MSFSSGSPLMSFRTLLQCLMVTLLFSPPSYLNAQDHETQFKKGGELFAAGKYEEALELIRELNQAEDLGGALKENARWALISTLSKLSQSARHQEQWEASHKYSKEMLDWLDRSAEEFSGDFLEQIKVRQLWTCKNMVLACHGLGKFEKADEYRKKLYEAWDDKTLPEGLDRCFNFSFFRHGEKNVWGYEYYPGLDDEEAKGSFSKYVYFVYSTDDEGKDKDLLYRLHVLKFHKLEESDEGDFVLTKRWMDGEREVGQTQYKYIWSDPVNTEQLSQDILQYLEENSEPVEDEKGDPGKDG